MSSGPECINISFHGTGRLGSFMCLKNTGAMVWRNRQTMPHTTACPSSSLLNRTCLLLHQVLNAATMPSNMHFSCSRGSSESPTHRGWWPPLWLPQQWLLPPLPPRPLTPQDQEGGEETMHINMSLTAKSGATPVGGKCQQATCPKLPSSIAPAEGACLPQWKAHSSATLLPTQSFQLPLKALLRYQSHRLGSRGLGVGGLPSPFY